MNMKDILIVEDDALLRELWQSALEDSGYTCMAAANANEAYKILKTQSFLIVISDMEMLPGDNGLQLARSIREHNHMVYLIAITGNYKAFEIFDAREAGFDDYLTKPCDLSCFLESVDIGMKKIKRWLKIEPKSI